MIGLVRGTMRETKEVAGLPAPIASFRSSGGSPITSLIVDVNPIQDLHGYDHPWVGGAGKNELAMSVSSIKSLNTTGTWNGNEYTLNGVSFTIITDNDENVTGIKVNGTATNDTNFSIAVYTLKAGTSKKINGTSIDSSNSTIAYGFRGYGLVSANADRRMTRASDAGDWSNDVYIAVYTGYNANNLMYYPMIRDASISDATFEPYENICPITPRTSATVTHLGANIWGGDSLADTIVLLVPNSTKDTANKTVTFGSVQASNKVLFTTFKANTRYTIILSVASGNANMAVNYTDGTSSSLSNGVNVTNASKSVAYIRGQNQGGTSVLNYESCGIFEGVLTAEDFEPYVSPATYTKTFNACYGGKLNLTTGALEFTHALVDLGSLNWTYATDAQRWRAIKSDMKNYPTRSADVIFEKYGTDTTASAGSENKGYIAQSYIYVHSTDSTNAPSGNAVYPLADPYVALLTKEEIKTLLGGNTFYADTGDVVEIKLSERIVTTLFSRG